ncbi:hypothetical protein ACFXKS_03830 [Streptomyces scopuliridis]|uniref:hypothetical protein n=1 Tax=Streptomyces scopuliridis TaxID=452529 RepID=UPI0036AAA807
MATRRDLSTGIVVPGAERSRGSVGDVTVPRVGTWVMDTERDKLGEVMGCVGTSVQLRPPCGGLEWDADPALVRPTTRTEELPARVSERNHRTPL